MRVHGVWRTDYEWRVSRLISTSRKFAHPSIDCKFAHLATWKNTNLHTKVEYYNFVHPTEACNFVHLHRGLYKFYTFIEDSKFVYLCRGFQICLSWYCLLTVVHRIIGMEYHCNSISIENRAGQNVAVYCDNYSREPVIGTCTKVFGKDVEIAWMEDT